jgi:hypothetical protein
MADEAVPVHQALIESTAIQLRQERRDIVRYQASKVTPCDGSAPELVRAWLRDVQALLVHLNDVAMLHEFMLSTSSGSFRNEIQALIEQHHPGQAMTWERMHDHLLAAFVSPDHVEYQKTLLRQVQQLPGEGILAYNRRFRTAAQEAFPAPQTPDQHREMVKLYGRGLSRASDAHKLVAENWPPTIETAFQRMLTRETGGERFRHLERVEEPMEVAATTPARVSETNQKHPQPLPSPHQANYIMPSADTGYVQRPNGHDNIDLSKQLEQIMTKFAKLEASQKVDKARAQGKEISRTPHSAADRRDRRTQRETRTCHYCQKQGHLKRDCRKFKRDQDSNVYQPFPRPPLN